MLPNADIVALTCTQTKATRGIINREFLAACKPGWQKAHGGAMMLLSSAVTNDVLVAAARRSHHQCGAGRTARL